MELRKTLGLVTLPVEVPGEETQNEWLEAVSDEEYDKL